MDTPHYDAVIVGAGAAGLVAAQQLEEFHLKTLVIEKANRVGGRLKTDVLDGFQLDRGFQVLLNSYPVLPRFLDLEALDLAPFRSGAHCFSLGKNFSVSDVKRKPSAALRMAFSPVGSFNDKLKLARLRREVLAKSHEEIFNEPDISTLEFLQRYKFSSRIIERFLQPFYSGIFLEPDLSTSARMFQFSFRMFALGEACLPANGIEAIALQLKEKLKQTEFRFNAEASHVEPGAVHLKNGEVIAARQIIVATSPGKLLPEMEIEQAWHNTQQLYFAAKQSPLPKAMIGLSFQENALVNNLAVLSDVSPSYAPKGQSLISVSLRHASRESEERTVAKVIDELSTVLGIKVETWRFLRSYKIDKALPRMENMQYSIPFEETRVAEGVYLAGDQLLNPSLNGAMLSGELAAKALIKNH